MGSVNLTSGGTVDTSIVNATIANNGNATTGAEITTDGTVGIRVLVSVEYSGTVNEGARVYILRRTYAGGWQVVAEAQYYEMPKAANSVRDYSWFINAISTKGFKVAVVNQTGAQIQKVYVGYQVVTGVTA